MKLYLIQHAEEAERDVDAERHLSPTGIRDVEVMGQFLERFARNIPHLLHSGKHRARETAERLAKHLDPDTTVEESEGLLARDDAAPWREKLNRYDQDVAIVSHMPFLSKLTSLLLAEREDADVIGFEKGTVACLERIEPNHWHLLWMVPPTLITR